MDEVFIIKNLLSAAAFGVAYVAERQRNGSAALGGDPPPSPDGTADPHAPAVTRGDVTGPSGASLFDAAWTAARTAGACCAVALIPDRRHRTHLLYTRSDGSLPDASVIPLAHCAAANRARTQGVVVTADNPHLRRMEARDRSGALPGVFCAPLGGAEGGVVVFGTLQAGGFRPEQAATLEAVATLADAARGQEPPASLEQAVGDASRSVAEGVPVPVILADAEGTVTAANHACLQLVALPAGALVGESLSACFRIMGVEEDPGSLVEQALAGGDQACFHTRHHLRATRPLTVQWQARRLPGALPDGPSIVLSGLDLTECLALQRELARTERLCAAGQLIAGVAHELNNPLTAVMSLAEMLREHLPEGDQRARMDRLVAQARRCSHIAGGLLGFVRGAQQPRQEALCINAEVAATVDMVQQQLERDDVRVRARAAPDLPGVLADPGQVQQMLVNLVMNAYHALAEAGGGTVEIATEVRDGGVAVTVTDDGPGIPEHILPCMFEPFVTTKPEDKGTGLGLSISRDIAVRHGGTLCGRNRAEGGAEFCLVLPSLEAGPTPGQKETGTATEKAPPVSGRLLVVDDEEPVRMVMAEALRRAGHQAEEAPDAETALELIRNHEYDLLISDLRLPGMGGDELYEEAVATRPSMRGAFLLTTGDSGACRAQEFLERCGVRSLEKPFTGRELVAVVNACMCANRAR